MDLTDEFTLEDEKGNRYRALEWRKRYMHGIADYRLDDGRHLNRTGETTFEIVESGRKLSRVD